MDSTSGMMAPLSTGLTTTYRTGNKHVIKTRHIPQYYIFFLFPGGGECLKEGSTPKNGSRERVKFEVTEKESGKNFFSTIEGHKDNFVHLGTNLTKVKNLL